MAIEPNIMFFSGYVQVETIKSRRCARNGMPADLTRPVVRIVGAAATTLSLFHDDICHDVEKSREANEADELFRILKNRQ